MLQSVPTGTAISSYPNGEFILVTDRNWAGCTVPPKNHSCLPCSCPESLLTGCWFPYCPAVSGVTGLALKETSFINRSLAALADVLGALSEHCDHIPYRNSKLTHLLQDSIGSFS